jgi:DNA-directed RNA polymerase specialized sigma24 family protein
MHGISIDDRPDGPVGTPGLRRAVAIHWHWTTEYTTEEIAKALGVKPQTVRKYTSEGPTDEVREAVSHLEAEVRIIAVQELKDQLQAAGHRSRTAEKPVKVYENDDGEVVVKDIENEMGQVVKKIPEVQDIRLLPDEQARYYARAEVRDILEQLTDLLGVGEPDELAVEHSGQIDGEKKLSLDEESRDAVRSALADRYGVDDS